MHHSESIKKQKILIEIGFWRIIVSEEILMYAKKLNEYFAMVTLLHGSLHIDLIKSLFPLAKKMLHLYFSILITRIHLKLACFSPYHKRKIQKYAKIIFTINRVQVICTLLGLAKLTVTDGCCRVVLKQSSIPKYWKATSNMNRFKKFWTPQHGYAH